MTKKLISELSLGRYIKHVNDAGNDIIKQYDKRIKLRTAGASKNDPDMKKASKRIARREKGIGMAANAFERFTKKNRLEEDGAPTVNAGGGNIAGIGVGPQGEPGVSIKAQRRQSKNKSTPTSVILGMLRRKAPNPIAETVHNRGGTIAAPKIGRKRTLHDRMAAYDKKPKSIRDVEKSAFASLNVPPNLHSSKAKQEIERIRRKSSEATYGKDYPSDIPPVRSEERESFAGATVFEVNSKLFHNLTLAKRKGKHWRTYLEEDDCYAEIREWARKNKGPIVVRNECTGEMRYVRYGR